MRTSFYLCSSPRGWALRFSGRDGCSWVQLGASGCWHPLLRRPLKVSSPKGNEGIEWKECTRPFARGSCLGCQVPTLPLPGKLSSHTLHLDSPPQHLTVHLSPQASCLLCTSQCISQSPFCPPASASTPHQLHPRPNALSDSTSLATVGSLPKICLVRGTRSRIA